jgi:hypothetical protein
MGTSKKRNICKLDFTIFIKSIGQNLDKILITVIAPTEESCGTGGENIVVTSVR